MQAPESTCLAIADLSGYTSYLAGVELTHAQDILADLMQALVTPLRPAFNVAKLEGDAVLLYAPIDQLDGSVLLDLLEGSYIGFRRRLRTIAQVSSCTCNACVKAPDLDLKLVVHHGPVARQEMLGNVELLGPDVIVVHRLLKNSVGADKGLKAYAFLSDACVADTALEPAALGMLRHVERYPDVGEVAGWVHDLEVAWQRTDETTVAHIASGDAVWASQAFIAGVEASLAWEWLTTPSIKITWEEGFDAITETPGPGGRRGTGTMTHCVHGDDTIDMEILDWRPPRYVTSRGAFPNGARFIVTDEIVPVDGGVVASKAIAAPTPDDEPALREVMAMFAPVLDTWMPRLRDLLEAHVAQRPTVVETALPRPDEQARLASSVG